MRHHLLACLVLPFALGSAAHAASEIETRENDGSTSRMLVSGNKARMESEPPDYILIDMDRREFLAIDPRTRQIIDMGQPPQPQAGVAPAPTPAPTPAAKLVDAGAGPRIAGYPTRRYRLLAQERICAETYLSREAMAAADVESFLRRFGEFQRAQKASYLAAGVEPDACEAAHEHAMSRYPELGMPLKTVDEDGFLYQEVVSIRTGITPPKGIFEAPAGFKRVSLDDILRDAAEHDFEGELRDEFHAQD